MTLSRLVKVGLVVVGLVLAVTLYPPLKLSALVLAGRSRACPYSQAVKVADNARLQTELKDRILSQSKEIARDGELQQWQTPAGTFWVPYESRYGLHFHLAEQQRNIYGDGNLGVRPGDIVLDCGANIGTFTRTALNRGAKTVVAIEPAPENIECMRRNFKSEIADGRVILYTKGVWDKDDWLTMEVDNTNSAADTFVMHPKDAKPLEQKLPLTTIDKLFAELKLERVDFIKMDIEGAEPRALVGGKETIGRFHPRLAMSMYHEADHVDKIPRVIHQIWPGYRSECGPCMLSGTEIKPHIMFFY